MDSQRVVGASGSLSLIVPSEMWTPPDKGPGFGRAVTWDDVREHAMPQKGLPDYVNDFRGRNCVGVISAAKEIIRARRILERKRIPAKLATSALWLRHITADGDEFDLGLACMRVITDRGVEWIVDSHQNLKELEDMKFHGIGTGGAAEAVGNTILTTELTTQYNNGGDIRATGTLTEGASANIFRTVATNTVDSAVAITEHGLFSQAATGAESATNRLFDRSLFSVVNLASGDSLASSLEITYTSGG